MYKSDYGVSLEEKVSAKKTGTGIGKKAVPVWWLSHLKESDVSVWNCLTVSGYYFYGLKLGCFVHW